MVVRMLAPDAAYKRPLLSDNVSVCIRLCVHVCLRSSTIAAVASHVAYRLVLYCMY